MLSEALRLLRTYHQQSQSVLANKLEISNSYLCEIEKGVKAPSIDLLNKYSEIYKMPVSTILLFSEEANATNKTTDRIRFSASEKVLKLMAWIADKEAVQADA